LRQSVYYGESIGDLTEFAVLALTLLPSCLFLEVIPYWRFAGWAFAGAIIGITFCLRKEKPEVGQWGALACWASTIPFPRFLPCVLCTAIVEILRRLRGNLLERGCGKA
jgi:hypothetical protein